MSRDKSLGESVTAPLTGVNSLKAKYQLLRKICCAYSLVIMLVLTLALLRYKYPMLEKTVLREEVGVIGFVCFIALQVVFEIDNEVSITAHPVQFYTKVVIYILDLCVMINGRVKASITIFSSLFALIQLGYLYYGLHKKYELINRGGTVRVEDHNYQLVGTFTVIMNIIALALILGNDSLFHISPDVLKSLITGGVVMYYFHVVVNSKAEELMGPSYVLTTHNIAYHSLRIIRPIGNSLLAKLKKLKKIKFKS